MIVYTRTVRRLLGALIALMGLLSAPAAVPIPAQTARPELFMQGGHTMPLRFVALSPDANYLVSISFEAALVWDLHNDLMIKRLDVPPASPFTSMGFSPSGRLFAAGDGGQVRIWSTETWQALPPLDERSREGGSSRRIPFVAWGRDDATMFVAWDDGSVQIVDPATHATRDFAKMNGTVSCIWADDRALALGTSQGTIYVLDAASGKVMHTCSRRPERAGGDDYVGRIVMNHAHTALATIGREEPVIQVIDPTTNTGIFSHREQANGLVFTPDGDELGSAVNNVPEGIVMSFWNIHTGERTRAMYGAFEVIADIATDHDAEIVAGGSFQKNVKLWNARTGELIRTLGANAQPPVDLAYNRSGTFLASLAPDGAMRIWEAATGRQMVTIPYDVDKARTSGRGTVAVSDDGKLVATAGDTVHVWNVADGSPRSIFLRWDERTLAEDPAARNTAADIVLTDASGSTAYSFRYGTITGAWNAVTGANIWSNGTIRETVEAAALSRDGRMLAAIDEKGGVWIMSTRDGALVARAERPDFNHYNAKFAIAFSADARTLLTADNNGLLVRRSARSGEVIDSTRLGYIGAQEVAFAPDASRLAATFGDSAMACTIADGARIPIAAVGDRYDRPAFDDAGTMLVATTTSGQFSLTNLRTPKSAIALGHRWGPGDTVRNRNSHYTQQSLLSSDGTLVVGLYEDAVVVWRSASGDVVDRQPLLRIPGGPEPKTVAISGDASRIIIGYSKANSLVWDRTRHTLRPLLPTGGDVVQRTGRRIDASAVGFLPNSHALFVASNDSVWTIDAESGTAIDAHALPTHDFTITPASGAARFAVISSDSLLIYSVEPWRVLARFPYNSDDYVPLWRALDSAGELYAAVPTGGRNVAIFETATGRRLRTIATDHQVIQSVHFAPSGSMLVTTGLEGNAVVWNPRTGERLRQFTIGNGASSIAEITPDRGHLITAGADAWLRLWDLREGRLTASLLGIGAGDFAVATPDGYYTASKGAASAVAVRIGDAVYPFDQFDLRLNRPDRVLHALGTADPALIEAYYNAYRKRLQKLQMDERRIEMNTPLPELAVTSPPPPALTRDTVLRFEIHASDAAAPIARILVSVNDVPVFGSGGIDCAGSGAALDREIVLPLVQGINRVKVSVLNAAGVESLRRSFTVTRETGGGKPDLYVITIGVSKFTDARYNLSYAAKDAGDIAEYFGGKREHFGGKREHFGAVHAVQLLDGAATRDSIRALHAMLMRSRPDDHVVLFVATHGLVDDSLEYYLATADIDFERPRDRGLRYDELEEILDGIPARRKLLLVDACHSGEIDRDAVHMAAGSDSLPGSVKRRALPRSKRVKTELGLQNSFALARELFADLRRSSGTTVIAAAAGEEFAYEDATWKNGAFTYALLDGLTTKDADANRDGTIMVSELRAHVTRVVRELTGGRQTPTSRRENLTNDFPVLP